MKIKTLLIAAIACVALVCTGCSKEETKIVVEVEYFVGFDGLQQDGAGQQFLDECTAAFAPYSGTTLTDSKVIGLVDPIVAKYNNCNKLEGTATLYKSQSGSTRTVVKTWSLYFGN